MYCSSSASASCFKLEMEAEELLEDEDGFDELLGSRLEEELNRSIEKMREEAAVPVATLIRFSSSSNSGVSTPTSDTPSLVASWSPGSPTELLEDIEMPSCSGSLCETAELISFSSLSPASPRKPSVRTKGSRSTWGSPESEMSKEIKTVGVLAEGILQGQQDVAGSLALTGLSPAGGMDMERVNTSLLATSLGIRQDEQSDQSDVFLPNTRQSSLEGGISDTHSSSGILSEAFRIACELDVASTTLSSNTLHLIDMEGVNDSLLSSLSLSPSKKPSVPQQAFISQPPSTPASERSSGQQCWPGTRDTAALGEERLVNSAGNDHFAHICADYRPGSTTLSKVGQENKPGNTTFDQICLENKPGNTTFDKIGLENKLGNATFDKICLENKPGNTTFDKIGMEAKPGNTTFDKIGMETKPGNATFDKIGIEAKPGNTTFDKVGIEIKPGNTTFDKIGLETKPANTTFDQICAENKLRQTNFSKNDEDRKLKNSTYDKNSLKPLLNTTFDAQAAAAAATCSAGNKDAANSTFPRCEPLANQTFTGAGNASFNSDAVLEGDVVINNATFSATNEKAKLNVTFEKGEYKIASLNESVNLMDAPEGVLQIILDATPQKPSRQAPGAVSTPKGRRTSLPLAPKGMATEDQSQPSLRRLSECVRKNGGEEPPHTTTTTTTTTAACAPGLSDQSSGTSNNVDVTDEPDKQRRRTVTIPSYSSISSIESERPGSLDMGIVTGIGEFRSETPGCRGPRITSTPTTKGAEGGVFKLWDMDGPASTPIPAPPSHPRFRLISSGSSMPEGRPNGEEESPVWEEPSQDSCKNLEDPRSRPGHTSVGVVEVSPPPDTPVGAPASGETLSDAPVTENRLESDSACKSSQKGSDETEGNDVQQVHSVLASEQGRDAGGAAVKPERDAVDTAVKPGVSSAPRTSKSQSLLNRSHSLKVSRGGLKQSAALQDSKQGNQGRQAKAKGSVATTAMPKLKGEMVRKRSMSHNPEGHGLPLTATYKVITSALTISSTNVVNAKKDPKPGKISPFLSSKQSQPPSKQGSVMDKENRGSSLEPRAKQEGPARLAKRNPSPKLILKPSNSKPGGGKASVPVVSSTGKAVPLRSNPLVVRATGGIVKAKQEVRKGASPQPQGVIQRTGSSRLPKTPGSPESSQGVMQGSNKLLKKPSPSGLPQPKEGSRLSKLPTASDTKLPTSRGTVLTRSGETAARSKASLLRMPKSAV